MTQRPLRRAPGQGFGMYPDSVFNLQEGDDLHPQLVKQARSSGQLNLSNRGLVCVPDKVWTLMELTKEEEETLRKGVSLETSSQENWWDHVELTKLILACNKISSISSQISNLVSLTILDLHDNQLSDLPTQMSALTNLRKLNLSHNRLKNLPEGFSELRELRNLQLNNNHLEKLEDWISDLSMLNHLDLSNNHLTSLPSNIGFLVQLTHLILSKNNLESLPSELAFMRALVSLDCTSNQLKSIPKDMQELHHLELVYLRHNQLTRVPCLKLCTQLKELQLGSNRISEVSLEDIENIPNIRTLELRDNKIKTLPDQITGLQLLERLDVSNNDLSTLPFTLGVLPHLKTLQVEGNPMKAIRRDIIARGTAGLLKYLRSRLEEDQIAELAKAGTGNVSPVPPDSPTIPDKFTMRSSQVVNLSKKGLTDIPGEAVENALEAKVNAVDASKNLISIFPESLLDLLPLLFELNLSSNKLSSVPSWIQVGAKLQFLDLSNNKLQQLPEEMGELKHLREIVLSFNQLSSIPPSLCRCGKLETILIANNKIAQLDVEALSALGQLAVLDLQNNAIESVPPELGNLTQLRALQLEGNLFRMPRPAVLVQGTGAVLSYLRDRIPK
ncbi:leucine-rich repeat-containing protein 40 [Eurytemora carolleeae]|uniref:leucine-rich repeat-containing protein 40 n=1 Tax=Eurytemora carolleeae TaxID=1294199 RepID=UPI000C76FF37|nr:leucine-rich repeat-containing protein 40 [Eurytemora carolleeae]|eukprot:XP_023341290.1 leucine-rich repeat-containing protein 40-like [Eurytemora affinis]